MSEQIGIFNAINRIMNEVGSIGKDRKNQQQGYSFRGIDDVYNALQPALVKHGVFIVPRVLKHTREERQTKSGGALIYCIIEVEHEFYAGDGSSIKALTIGEAMDSGDKASNKAMSAAMKYACLEVFAVPTQGDNDTENHSPEPEANRSKGNMTPAATNPTTSPAPVPDADAKMHPTVAGLKAGETCDFSGRAVEKIWKPEGKKTKRVKFGGDPTHYVTFHNMEDIKPGQKISGTIKCCKMDSGEAYYELSEYQPF